MSAQRLVKPMIAPAVVVLCLVGVVSLQLPKLNMQNRQLSKAEYFKQEQTEKTSLDLLKKLPSFGFDNLIADWAYLQFIQYFGDSLAREQTGYSLVPTQFEVVVNRDPRFVKALLFLSSATSLYAGRPDRTVALMNQSLKSLTPTLPKAYFVWLYKGVDEMLFTGDSQAARHSYEMASKWASLHKDPQSQGIAARTRKTAQFLARNPRSKTAQVNAWALILANAIDDSTRQFAIRRIRTLGGQVSITPQGEVKVEVPKID